MNHALAQTRRGFAAEDGAAAPLIIVLVAGLVVTSLWGASTVSLYGVRREVERAANLSALAGAASIPLIGIFASGEPQSTACGQAERLLTQARAPLSNNLSVTSAGPTCLAGDVTIEPLADWPLVEEIRDALETLTSTLGVPLNLICNPLVGGLLDPFLRSLTATDCATLRTAVDGLPENLSPATVTPRVRVGIRNRVEAPVPLPEFDGEHIVSATAVARRRFKNLIVLPAVRTNSVTGIAQPVADLWSGVPAPITQINPNPAAASVRDLLLPILWQANDALGNAVNPLLPPGSELDLSQLILDVQDLYDPPGGAAPPSPLDVAAEAARTGDPVVILRIFRMPILGIPALDFTAAYLTPLANGSFQALPIPLTNLTTAQGLFGATLVQ